MYMVTQGVCLPSFVFSIFYVHLIFIPISKLKCSDDTVLWAALRILV